MQSRFRNTTLAASVLVLNLLSQVAVAADRDTPLVKRGALLVGIGGCADCHTPFKMGASGPEKDLSKGLSGHPQDMELPVPPALSTQWNWAGSATMTAFVGPWGMTYSANLTPDRATGIGAWKEKDFIRTMRTGKHLGVARPILPPMPWQALSGLSEKDLQAIYAYLMAQPAIRNKVPDYVPPAMVTAKTGK